MTSKGSLLRKHNQGENMYFMQNIFINALSQLEHHKRTRRFQGLDQLTNLKGSFPGIINLSFVLGLNTHTIHI